ncbi:MAG: AAA family ATPase [Bacteroidota bacterium]
MTFRVKIKNFQSIEEGEIEVKGLTVISGSNNTGKTAWMRAVSGAFQNPDGHSFVRHGQKHSEVEVSFPEGQTVTWEKGKGINRYELNGQTYDGVGRRKVPEDILDLGVQPVVAGDLKIWPQFAPQWQGQVFLLDKSGSVIAQAISDTDKVGRLNKSLKKVESDIRSAKSKIKVRKEDIKKLEAHLVQYEGLDDVLVVLQRVDELKSETQKMHATLEWLVRQKVLRDQAIEVISRYEPVESVEIPSSDLFEEISRLKAEKESLLRLQSQWKSKRSVINRLTGDLPGLSTVDKMVVELQKWDKTIQWLKDSSAKMKKLSHGIGKLEDQVDSMTSDIALLETEIQELKEASPTCPLCGKELDDPIHPDNHLEA